MQKSVEIQGVKLHLSEAHTDASGWIGQREILTQLLACWLVVDPRDTPLSPRLVGSPGIGKTALAMAASKEIDKPVYVFQCTSDTRPEDLLVTPVLSENGKIAYHASPLVSAMIAGGVCVLDEGNRMNEKSWASLAPLLDHRRYVESVVAGISIPAHKDFRCCVTMNQDDSAFEIPDYILSRLQPTLHLGFPNREDEMEILQYHLPFCEPELLAMTTEFLQRSHELKLEFSPRDGINLLRYALKRLKQDTDHPISKDDAWKEALENCLGEEALNIEELAEKRNRSLGGESLPLGLGDFFFGSDDPLHPDRFDDSDPILGAEFEDDEDLDDDDDEDDQDSSPKLY